MGGGGYERQIRILLRGDPVFGRIFRRNFLRAVQWKHSRRSFGRLRRCCVGSCNGIANVDTGIAKTTITSESGNYRFNSLEPGRYVVSASKSGFRTTEVSLTLGTAETKGINITLPVASASETVSVTTEPPVLDTDENRLQTTLSVQP